GKGAHAVLADGSEVFVALADAIDVRQECRRLSGELTRLEQQLAALDAKLGNKNFVARAPAEGVAKEREKERAWRDQRQALADKLRSLGCSLPSLSAVAPAPAMATRPPSRAAPPRRPSCVPSRSRGAWRALCAAMRACSSTR